MKWSVSLFVVGLSIAATTAMSATSNAVPWSDDLEGYTNLTPLVDGTGGWYASSSDAKVQQDVKYEGSQAAMVPIDVTLSNRFGGATTKAFVDMYVKPVRYIPADSPTPEIDSTASAMFYINSNGYFVVQSGPTTNWVELTSNQAGDPADPVSESTFIRLTLLQVYTNKKWSIFQDGVLMKENVPFINTGLGAFGGFDVYNGSKGTTYVDKASAGSTLQGLAEPLSLDSDSDDMGDAWELYYFGSSLLSGAEYAPSYDYDSDGWSNQEESNASTDPTDLLDAPTQVFLPFIDTFENYADGQDINGTHGFSATSTNMIVQDAVVFQGTKALQIGYGEVGITNVGAGSPSYTNIWTDFVIQPGKMYWDAEQGVKTNTTVAFFVGTNGYVSAYDGTNQVVLDELLGGMTTNLYTKLDSNQWVRFVVHSDYVNDKWSIWMVTNAMNTNEMARLIGEDLDFFTNGPSAFSGITFTNFNSDNYFGYLDNLFITLAMPETIDTDGDFLPDSYENEHGLTDPTNNVMDSDGDGFTDLEEYVMNTDPNNAAEYLAITNADLASPASDDVVLTVFAGADRTYELLGADDPPPIGSWSNILYFTAHSPVLVTDVVAVAETDRRFYAVVANFMGLTVTSDYQMAMYRQDRDVGASTDTWFWVGIPVDYGTGSNSLDSSLGTQLARGLAGSGDSDLADTLHILYSGSPVAWSNFYLGADGRWKNDPLGGNATAQIAPGTAVLIHRKALAAVRDTAVFFGFPRRDHLGINVHLGWNLLSWPYDVSDTNWWFGGEGSGAATTNADWIVFIGNDGLYKKVTLRDTEQWRYLVPVNGGDATGQEFQPGQGFYYRSLSPFTWSPTNAIVD